jgi:hypothetical protein
LNTCGDASSDAGVFDGPPFSDFVRGVFMQSPVWGRALASAGCVVLIASVDFAPQVRAAAPHTDLAVPGRSNSTPSISADGDRVAIAWGASQPSGATDVFVAASSDGGRSFGAPVRVNDVDGDARLNGEQPPRVAITGATVSVVWTTNGENGTRLLFATSSDGGRRFANAAVVPGGDGPGNRGWENLIAADRRYVIWLDHRELARQDGEVAASHHDHAALAAKAAKPDGVAMAQKSKLYVAALDGATAPIAVTGGVCYCCKTALAAADGMLAAAWRHVYPGNIRDIAFTLSRDGGRTFAPPLRVSDDKWVLEGCPDDGPALAIDRARRVHVVWPTLITENNAETIALFYATSDDGKRFTPRERIPAQGMPHHPQIAIGFDGAPIVAWDESAQGSRRAAAARVTGGAGGRHDFAREVLGDVALYPVIAAVRDGVVAAWTSGKSPDSVIRVTRR